MLEVGGGGGGYGGTDWNGYDVRQMWSLLRGQQTDPHWKVVAGWRKTYELTSMHLSRLKTYREELAEAWPPEKSAASAAYVAQLDYLINHVQETYDAAVANYGAFSGATGAISGARTELKKLFDEFQANQARLDDYADKVSTAKERASSGKPQPSPGPSPVPTGRQDQLNYQARSLMYKLSSELVQAQAAIRVPPPYRPPMTGVVDPDSDPASGAGLGLPAPPVIPPVVTTPAPVPSGAPTPGSVAFPGGPGAVTGPVSAAVGGPILGGTNTLPAPGLINPTPPPQLPAPPPSPGLIGPPIPPVTTPAVKPTTGIIGAPGTPPRPVPGASAALPRPMPPGGVIGPVGQSPSAARSPMPRVNPVGGVIGQRPTAGPGAGGVPGARPTTTGPLGSSPVGGGARTAGMAGGVQGGRAGRRSDEDESAQRWDPDNPWATAQGTSPVVEPPAAPDFTDPGPAIGLDR